MDDKFFIIKDFFQTFFEPAKNNHSQQKISNLPGAKKYRAGMVGRNQKAEKMTIRPNRKAKNQSIWDKNRTYCYISPKIVLTARYLKSISS